MTPSAKELIFDAAEMHSISVHCGNCGTGILFDAKKVDTGLPHCCSVCQKSIELEGELLGQYRKFYQRMMDSKCRLQFRVVVPAHE